MKKFIFGLMIASSNVILAQVGVNTSNPQQVFHIDGAKDNPVTGAPNAAQQINDFVVSSTGSTGIGNAAPTQKLDVNGNVRVRDLADGSNAITYPRSVVAQTDGTLGYRDDVVNIKKQVYVANNADDTRSVVLDKFEFRFLNVNGTAATPQFRLTSNPGSNISVFYHIEERWNNSTNNLNGGNGGSRFITLEHPVTTANWGTWSPFNGVAAGVSNQARNMDEFSATTIAIQYANDPNVYTVEFKIIDIPNNPETYSILVQKY